MKAKVNDVWKFVKKYKYKDTNNEWKEIATIKANFGQDGWHEVVPPNAIILYDLPKGSLPKTAILCNESNGTPNILNRYVMMTTLTGNVFNIGGATSHSGSAHGTANGNGGYTDYEAPGWRKLHGGNTGTNRPSRERNDLSTTHRHTTTSHSHTATGSNNRKRKRLQPTMFDDVIRTNAVFLNLYGIMGILELVTYGGFLELCDSNEAYLSDSDNEAWFHNHGSVSGTSGSYSMPLDVQAGQDSAATTYTKQPHTHSLSHTMVTPGSISFPNQDFYTGKTTRNTYWDELPYGSVCLFISDLMPKGWEKLSTVKKYSNGLVTSEVSTEDKMIFMNRDINSNTTSSTTHNHEGYYTSGSNTTETVAASSGGVDEYRFANHTHSVKDYHSTQVSHLPPYIQLYVGYKVLPTYTVTFDANGGSGSQSSIVKTYNISLTMPACTFVKPGYKLKNWNTSPDGNGLAFSEGSSSFNLNKDTTLYAIWEVDVNISAGTYTPSNFKSLISQYISENGSRVVAKSFSATVNNQTITVNERATVYYKSDYGGQLIFVGFGSYSNSISAITSSSGFTNYKTYLLYSGSGFNGSQYGGNYTNYSITIGGGISFV